MASPVSPPAGGDRNRGPALATTTISLDILATTFVLVRLYVRSRVVKQLGLDDFFIIMALVSIAHAVSSDVWAL